MDSSWAMELKTVIRSSLSADRVLMFSFSRRLQSQRFQLLTVSIAVGGVSCKSGYGLGDDHVQLFGFTVSNEP
jgi:hypothetical protein